jgi:hypothetical protein
VAPAKRIGTVLLIFTKQQNSNTAIIKNIPKRIKKLSKFLFVENSIEANSRIT